MDAILTTTNGDNVGCEESRNSNIIEPYLQGCMKSVVSCVQRKTNISEGDYRMWAIGKMSYTCNGYTIMNYRYPKVEGNILVNYESRYSGYRRIFS